jgi:Flp pilus assembly pilin Flp
MLCVTNTFRHNKSGATATEYATLIVSVALAIAAGPQTLGGGITDLFNSVRTTFAKVTMLTL